MTRQELPNIKDRVYSLSILLGACAYQKIEIEKISPFMNGFIVIFKDFDGDAILHDGSYGRGLCKWETIGFPWDGEDVSIHSPAILAEMLGALKRGEDWEWYERSEK